MDFARAEYMIDAGTESPTNVTRTGALVAAVVVPAKVAAATPTAARQAMRRTRKEIVWVMARYCARPPDFDIGHEKPAARHHGVCRRGCKYVVRVGRPGGAVRRRARARRWRRCRTAAAEAA